jgi:hypothetical protein
MSHVSPEMPVVSQCAISDCGFNVDNNCHAKAITVGDYTNPGCDTFMLSDEHNREKNRLAGVGACKVNGCKYNDDFECTADGIAVGLAGEEVNCLTYSPEM